MNYFIFKNVDSRNIQGLIVQELPPITKPAMRINITEIDGRDGEIIEELGYQAYDKMVLIGLTKDYNINEIISFLNGQGKLILSNETDKYYNVKIIEQIDFERLVKFRTAKVKFHTQPYKYKTDDEYVLANDSIENEGNEESQPIIRLERLESDTVDITINEVNIKYKFNNEAYVEIDCEKKTIQYENLNRNRETTIGYDFPKLCVGSNTITFNLGTRCNVKFMRKDRWL